METWTYRHTQRGVVIQRAVLVAGMLSSAIIGVGWLLEGASPSLLVAGVALAGLLAAVHWLAGSLTVTVGDSQLRIALGIGVVHRTIPLSAIRDCHRVRNRWWYGWGIRLTPRGWLWNVSGLDAVEVTYRRGGHFRIGTDDPDRLCEAIRLAIGTGNAPRSP